MLQELGKYEYWLDQTDSIESTPFTGEQPESCLPRNAQILPENTVY